MQAKKLSFVLLMTFRVMKGPIALKEKTCDVPILPNLLLLGWALLVAQKYLRKQCCIVCVNEILVLSASSIPVSEGKIHSTTKWNKDQDI